MENNLIKKHHVLILGALKKCHVTIHHPQFEDYLQIARWTLIDTHRRFIKEDKPLDGFNSYVFQRIYWKITDEIRKELSYTDRVTYGEEEEDLINELPDTTKNDSLEVRDILETISPFLTPQEALFIEEAYLNDLTITAISKKHNVSRQAVYKWRDRVALKIIRYYQK